MDTDSGELGNLKTQGGSCGRYANGLVKTSEYVPGAIDINFGKSNRYSVLPTFYAAIENLDTSPSNSECL